MAVSGQRPTVVEAMLPRAVSEEILRRYADVLRVGRLFVNGQEMAWETDKSTELQLKSFCECLFQRLSEVLPDLARANPEIIRFAAYWFCKSVSINYALIEVLLLIKQKVGVLCTIETREPGAGALVDYNLDAQRGANGSNILRVSLNWRKANNLVYRDPEKTDSQVKGTLTCLATEFPLPPDEGFLPAYCLQMRFRRSLAARFASTLACGGRPKAAETIRIDEPLRSHHPLETSVELAARPMPQASDEAASLPTGSADRSCVRQSAAASPQRAGSLEVVEADQRVTTREHDLGCRTDSREPLLSNLISRDLSINSYGSGSPGRLAREASVTSWLLGEDQHLDSPAAHVGYLRIRILRARTVSKDVDALALHIPERIPELYATCLLADRVERTKVVAEGRKPEWLEAWTFPVRGQDLRDDIVIELFDNGMFGASDRVDFCGRAAVPVSAALSASGVVALSEPLRGGWCGTIDLELELLPRSPNLVAVQCPEEEQCNVEVGSSISLTPPPASAPPTAKPIAPGVSVKVRSASPATGLRGLWCSKACTLDFS